MILPEVSPCRSCILIDHVVFPDGLFLLPIYYVLNSVPLGPYARFLYELLLDMTASLSCHW
jgi:hypothetical protein